MNFHLKTPVSAFNAYRLLSQEPKYTTSLKTSGDETTGPDIKRVLSKVTYSELVNRFDFLQSVPQNLPKSATEFGIFVLTYDNISDSWGESEYFRVSTDENAFDDNGSKLFVEDVINNRSEIIRCKLASTAASAIFTTT